MVVSYNLPYAPLNEYCIRHKDEVSSKLYQFSGLGITIYSVMIKSTQCERPTI